ncbi:MAG: 5'/3'-nucleotidase SurE [Phycisphaerales bacterium]|jgi:5'-nucleotidase|nr:5'/3'-nucleotidase SurE [Phycisphaerales bacterium]
MRILISNDDGILAPGIAALYAAVADMGDVSVVAPHGPQSASSHAITIRTAITTGRVELATFSGISVDGRPADCVRLALRELLDEPPDIVLSGINDNSNVGVNLFYSGTVAAAAEAAMMGIPAVAFSAEANDRQPDFPRAAALCRKVLDQLIADGMAPGDLINVNIPDLTAPGRPTGLSVVHQSDGEIHDKYIRKVTPDGRETWSLSDSYSYGPHHHAESDVGCLREGRITVTPLRVDMTRYDRLEKIAAIKWDDIA